MQLAIQIHEVVEASKVEGGEGFGRRIARATVQMPNEPGVTVTITDNTDSLDVAALSKFVATDLNPQGWYASNVELRPVFSNRTRTYAAVPDGMYAVGPTNWNSPYADLVFEVAGGQVRFFDRNLIPDRDSQIESILRGMFHAQA